MSRSEILIIDDDRVYAEKLVCALEGLFQIETCYSEAEFLEKFAVGRFDLLIMDMRLEKNREGLDLLKDVFSQDPTQAAIVMTAYADTETYADALLNGALTYLDKKEFSPILIARTVEAILRQATLQKRITNLERQLENAEPLELVGRSEGIRRARAEIQRAADKSDTPVIITGEPGTGRELVARNIHRHSRRRSDGPFVHATCGRLSPSGMMSALFGTFESFGRLRTKESKGWADEARGGVLFIDGLDCLDLNVSNSLQRVIETGIFSRSGGDSEIKIDAQVIVSLSISFKKNESTNVFWRRWAERPGKSVIKLPALRDRTEDLQQLASYLLDTLYRQGRSHCRSLRSSALVVLEKLPWPGNVPELKSALEYAAIRADATGSREVGPEHLPQSISEVLFQPAPIPTAFNYELHLARAELCLVDATMAQFETSKIEELAAKLRYSNRFTFSRRIRRHLKAHPSIAHEFPNVSKLFTSKKG